MKKDVLYTKQAEAFIETLAKEAQKKVRKTFHKLEMQGFLRAPEPKR